MICRKWKGYQGKYVYILNLKLLIIPLGYMDEGRRDISDMYHSRGKHERNVIFQSEYLSGRDYLEALL
jgi:hypothetical protein